MHFYWRVVEELKFLGETWTFNDPNLLRSYNLWVQKNADAIAFSLVMAPVNRSPFFHYKGITHSLN